MNAGTHEVAVSFNNDAWLPDEGLDRNLYVDWFEVTGPMEALEEEPVNPIREAWSSANRTRTKRSRMRGIRSLCQEILEAFVPVLGAEEVEISLGCTPCK